MMYDHEKSDPAIVAVKPTNKAGQPAAELAEPRAGAEGNVSQQSTGRAQYRETVSPGAEAHTARCEDIAKCRLHTRGGSRMPELGSYGSVRGARGNSRPYRESGQCTVKMTRLTLTGCRLRPADLCMKPVSAPIKRSPEPLR
jgi:hypothetical protein